MIYIFKIVNEAKELAREKRREKNLAKGERLRRERRRFREKRTGRAEWF